MIKSKVVRIFKTFNKFEKASLRKWVNSPVHNQHKDVIQIIEYLLSRRNFSAVSLDRVRIFHHLYPEQTFNQNRLNHVFSLTNDVIENFIRFLMSKNEDISSEINLNRFYRERNLSDLANITLLKAHEQLKSFQFKTDNYYHNSFLLEHATFELKGTEQRQQQTNLQDIFSSLTTFTIIATLRNACTAISHKSLFKTDYHIPLLNSILKEAASSSYDSNPVIKCYYYSYLALTQPENELHFKQLKKLLTQQHIPLPPEELKHVALLAINYCIKRLNMGSEHYVQEVFDIYKFGLKQTIWLESGQLSHNTFKNIATAALRLKEYEWTAKFIEDFGKKINETHQKDYTNYVKAKLLFEQAYFREAQDILLDTKAIDLFLGLAIKILLLKIYFELEEFVLLEAHLESFNVYLNRKKVLAYHKKIYGNTISVTRKIINANKNDLKEVNNLKETILKTKPLTELPWFMEKLDDLLVSSNLR